MGEKGLRAEIERVKADCRLDSLIMERDELCCIRVQ